MADAKNLLDGFKKKYGDKIGGIGGGYEQSARAPTGVFALDLALGGGFPRGRLVIVYGPEASTKTSAALKVIAANQRNRPGETNVYVDLENSFDPDWAAKLGVNTGKLIVIKPDYAEQAVDIVESLLFADDIGIVVVDSIAAMVTTAELDASAEKGAYGGSSIVVGRLVRKAVHALCAAEKEGRFPLLICINQVRTKLGVVYGDPEVIPGGNALRFASSMTVRFYGKPIVEEKVSKTVPIFREVNFVVKKNKAPIVATNGVYHLVTFPHGGLQVGATADWNTVSGYLKGLAWLAKKEKGQGWVLFDTEYPTLAAISQRFVVDAAWGDLVRKAVIEKVLADANPAATPPVVVDEDGVVS